MRATVPYFDSSRKSECVPLLRAHHYIGSQCADPSLVFVWRRSGGLFGEHGAPCAAALFAPPASFAWGRYAIELTRLVRDETVMPPLTMFLGECIRDIRRAGRYRLLIAYADPSVGHHGGIYQASNWLYVGESSRKVVYVSESTGKRSSQRSFAQSNYNESEWTKTTGARKFTYVYPLTTAMRKEWSKKSLPYPKPALTTKEP